MTAVLSGKAGAAEHPVVEEPMSAHRGWPPGGHASGGSQRADARRAEKDALRVREPTLDEVGAGSSALDAPALPLPHGPAVRTQSAAASIVYGPISSRRFGRSLGIDLSPAGWRACSFDCVYCELPAPLNVDGAPHWPSAGDVESALGQALPRAGPLDSITIAGRGEPTLHPRFGAVVAAVLAQARRGRPGTPVRILTNGSTLVRADVRRALDLLDERVVAFDAGPERVDRPEHPLPLGSLVAGATLLRDVSVQSCFVVGEISNTDVRSVEAWIDVLAALRPRAVWVHSLSRPSARARVQAAPAPVLEAIAARLRSRTGLVAKVTP
jgi:wyosine [tRNA(Phe)-imidazoG37] synthetase (radical SAM superfamily)